MHVKEIYVLLLTAVSASSAPVQAAVIIKRCYKLVNISCFLISFVTMLWLHQQFIFGLRIWYLAVEPGKTTPQHGTGKWVCMSRSHKRTD